MLDDDKAKIGGYIHGIKVLGAISILRESIAKYQAAAVIIAIPSLNHKILREIYQCARDCGLKQVKIVRESMIFRIRISISRILRR